jgi:hypothetical protein
MNSRIGSFYVAIQNNEVIAFETNLKEFIRLVNAAVPGTRNYDWFYRRFDSDSKFSISIGSEEYFFQKLI